MQRIAIPEADIVDAVGRVREYTGEIIEPSAAVAFAAARAAGLAGAHIGIISSGGNVGA